MLNSNLDRFGAKNRKNALAYIWIWFVFIISVIHGFNYFAINVHVLFFPQNRIRLKNYVFPAWEKRGRRCHGCQETEDCCRLQWVFT